MDIVLIYPVNDRWHWRRINDKFEELFYSPVYFPTPAAARGDAEQANSDSGNYRLLLLDTDLDEEWA